MSDRDEVQVARWSAIKGRVGSSLRELRQTDLYGAGTRSQARLAGVVGTIAEELTVSVVCAESPP